MLPITVDVARVRVLLVGEGEAARRRLALLDAAGARWIGVYAPVPSLELAAAAGARLRRRLPQTEEITRAHLVFLAGAGEPAASRLQQLTLGAGVLLNVEDDIARSNFHSPAVVRRGDLTLAISTGGKSPGLAAAIRREIDERFGSEWAARLERIAALRARWREDGEDAAAVARRTAAWLDRQGGIATKRPPRDLDSYPGCIESVVPVGIGSPDIRSAARHQGASAGGDGSG